MTTLCEECFAAHGDREVLTIVPMSPCVSCGRYDMRHNQGLRCHLFRSDPRPDMTVSEKLRAFEFTNGMTVADLKELIRDWPEVDENGEPCEVWLCDSSGMSNQARMATPLNMRSSEDGKKAWADFMLGHDA